MREISRTGKAGGTPMSKRCAGTHPIRDGIRMGRLRKWAWARFARRALRAPPRKAAACHKLHDDHIDRSSSDPRCGGRGASKHAIHHVQGGRSSIHRGASQASERQARGTMADDRRHLSWTRFWCAISTSPMCTECLSQPGRRKPETAAECVDASRNPRLGAVGPVR